MASKLLLLSIAAGACFFVWPIRMNQSGLSSASASLSYATVAVVSALGAMLVTPGSWQELQGAALRAGLEAGVFNAVGIMAFSYMLAHATRIEAPRLILVVITTQTSLTGAWAAYQARSLEPRTVLALALAIVTVYLLRGK